MQKIAIPKKTIGFVLLITALAVQAEAKLRSKVFTASEEGFLVTSTILYGDTSAGVVDGQFLLTDARNLVKEIQAIGKPLAWVYVTHAHPDHYFGLEAIREAYPNVKFYAAPEVVTQIQATAAKKVEQWKPTYKEKLTSAPVIPEPLDADSVRLDGARIEFHRKLTGDSYPSTLVYVPSLKEAITGDIAYSDVNVWLSESTPESRVEWLKAIEHVSAMKPKTVVAGHKTAKAKDSPKSLNWTRTYIQEFEKAAKQATTAEELVAAMKKKYPKAALPAILQMAAQAVKPPAGSAQKMER